MKQPTTDRNDPQPFLMSFAVPMTSVPTEKLRYDDDRMILMVGDIPAILADSPVVSDSTLHTAIRQETTDDR